jgi:MFS family permease
MSTPPPPAYQPPPPAYGVPPPQPSAQPGQVVQPPPPYGMPSPQMQDIARRSIEIQTTRTKNGCLLFGVGSVISSISVLGGYAVCIGFLGALLALIGAILIVLGRTAYSERHQRFVILAVIFFILGIVIAVAMMMMGAMQVMSAAMGGSTEGVKQSIMIILLTPLVTAAISGLAEVFLAHELTSALGRKLLYVAYILYILAGVVVAALGWGIMQDIQNLDAQGLTDKINMVYNAQYAGGAISVVHGILIFIAYYFAWSRVSSGEAYRELMGSTTSGMPPPPPPPPPISPPQQPTYGAPPPPPPAAPGMAPCPYCGTPNPTTATVCQKCGARLR